VKDNGQKIKDNFHNFHIGELYQKTYSLVCKFYSHLLDRISASEKKIPKQTQFHINLLCGVCNTDRRTTCLSTQFNSFILMNINFKFFKSGPKLKYCLLPLPNRPTKITTTQQILYLNHLLIFFL
jgi:hypothetical protein